MRFHVVHNIPSPYRLHLFAKLHEELRERGGALHVHFMAKNHPDRPASWERDPSTLPFPASLHRDFGPTLGNRALHFNPGLIAALGKARPDVVMVGGPWDSPTTLLASSLAFGDFRIAWYEPNTMTPGRVTGVARSLKRTILQRYQLVAVPGDEGTRFTRDVLGLALPVTTLPNLVDEERFANVPPADVAAIRGELGLVDGRRVALLPARLSPEKGIRELLAILEPQWLTDWELLIVGDGPLRPEILSVIGSRGLSGRVRLVPSIPYDRMPALYRASQLFVLPSLYDPNPLSVVEALHSGVSLLLSRRVGNLPEALREGVNGFSFVPDDAETVRVATRKALGAGKEELDAMGLRSREQARFWNTGESVRRFLDVVATMRHA